MVSKVPASKSPRKKKVTACIIMTGIFTAFGDKVHHLDHALCTFCGQRDSYIYACRLVER